MAKLKTSPITRVGHLSKEDFIKNYYIPQRPVLIENLTDDWKARQNWNLDYIQALAGDQVVPLYNNEPTKGKQNSAVPATKMKLYDYLEILKREPTDLRIFFYNILDKMPQLGDDFNYPDLGLKFFKRLPVMFFGGCGSKVLPHYDMDLSDLFHFHFHGHKSVLLFPPDQTQYLYRVPYSVHNLETIDMDAPDFEAFPALEKAEGQYVEMKHGEALYIPSGYWHYIKYLDGGFSITLRALPQKPGILLKMLGNLFLMRPFENVMRRIWGQKWVDYKEARMLRKINGKYGK